MINPITFIEESLKNLKDLINNDSKGLDIQFDKSFFQKLKIEAQNSLTFCEELNKDSVIVNKLNEMLSQNSQNEFLLKAERFLISDLILFQESLNGKNKLKSQLVFAYFYDVLRNKHFANESQIVDLNKLISEERFKTHLDLIKSQNRLASKTQNKSFLLSVISDSKSEKAEELIKHIKIFFSLCDENLDTINFDDFVTKVETKNELVNENIVPLNKKDSLEIVLKELNELIGLKEVKKNVSELINLLEIQKKRSNEGLKNVEITLHTVFLGPPGTGKTTVARLLSRIYKHLGFLSKGQLYETDREGMIAGYVGQTAPKVEKVVSDSLGGVLFIDEAYSLTQNFSGNDFGAEALSTLLKRMEDHRDDLAVVVAGYKEPMKLFIESNPGLRSRFNRFFEFEHFTPEELLQIFELFCSKSDFVIDTDAKEKLQDTFDLLFEKKDESFGNARVVRNLFERCVQLQANRIISLKKINQKVLKTFTEEDIPEPKITLKEVTYFTEE